MSALHYKGKDTQEQFTTRTNRCQLLSKNRSIFCAISRIALRAHNLMPIRMSRPRVAIPHPYFGTAQGAVNGDDVTPFG